MSEDEKVDPLAFGNVARIFTDEVTGVHVRQAVKLQQANPELRIGDAMVELGAMTEKQRDDVAETQKRLRRGKYKASDVRAMLSYAVRKMREKLGGEQG